MSSQSGIRVSVIIPTYNRSKLIIDTVDSFLAQDYFDYEIIVCNNNSTDDTAEVLKRYQAEPKVRVLTERRQGVHYARNTAALAATGDVLYFTDDDMIGEPDLLKELVRVFEIDSKVGVVTGRVVPKWLASPPAWVLRHMANYLLSLNDPPHRLLISDDDCNVFSCHQAIKRTVFFEAGGFNPEYVGDKFMGDGETGLNLKIKRLGYRFGFTGGSVVHHVIPASRMTQAYLNSRYRNNARAEACTRLREKNGQLNVWEESGLEIRRLIKNVLKHLLRSVSDVHRLRFIPAEFAYFQTKFEYYRLFRGDSGHREFVLRNDWLK